VFKAEEGKNGETLDKISRILGHLSRQRSKQNIKKIVQKMAFIDKGWLEVLPFALLRYCTSVHISTGATPPPSPICNMEVVLHVEVEVPSIGVLLKSKLDRV
jgi:hypothetical protein